MLHVLNAMFSTDQLQYFVFLDVWLLWSTQHFIVFCRLFFIIYFDQRISDSYVFNPCDEFSVVPLQGRYCFALGMVNLLQYRDLSDIASTALLTELTLLMSIVLKSISTTCLTIIYGSSHWTDIIDDVSIEVFLQRISFLSETLSGSLLLGDAEP